MVVRGGADGALKMIDLLSCRGKTEICGNLLALCDGDYALGRIRVGSYLDLIELDLVIDGRPLGRSGERRYPLFGGSNFYPDYDPSHTAPTRWRPWQVEWERNGARVRRSVLNDTAAFEARWPRTGDVWVVGRVANGFAGRVTLSLAGTGLVIAPDHRDGVLALDFGVVPAGLAAGHDWSGRQAAVRTGRAPLRAFFAARDADVFFGVRLGPRRALTLGAAWAKTGGAAARAARAAARHPGRIRRGGEAGWRSFMTDQVPRLACDDPAAERAYAWSFGLLLANRYDYRRAPLRFPHTAPSKFWYTNQWWWDSGFHAVGQRWLADNRWALHELDNYLDRQRPDGMIPAELLVNRRYGRLWFSKSPDPWTSEATINPVPAWILWKIFESTGDRGLLHRWYAPLVRYHDWYLAKRRRGGLLFTTDAFEIQDDSPRYDALRERVRDGHRIKPVCAIETNVFFALQARTLVRMAEVLGRPRDARRLAADGRAVERRMKAAMWDPRRAFFFDRVAGSGARIPIRTNAAFLALLVDVLDPQERRRLLDHARAPGEFWTRAPLPVVARDERSFDPDRMWRGPTWLNMNWLIVEGLRRTGEHALAAGILRRQVAMIARDGFPRLDEWYNPLTGRALGAPDYGWSATVGDQLLTAGAGLMPAPGGLRWHPLDLGWRRMDVGPVMVRGRRVRVALARGTYRLWIDGKRVEALRAGGAATVRLG